MKNYLLILAVFSSLLYTINLRSQCDMMHSPSFELSLPVGVQIDSAFIEIQDYYSNNGIRSRARSFNYFENTGWFQSDGMISLLDTSLSGPLLCDLQIDPALDMFCGLVSDSVSFDWTVRVYCSGLSGENINYSGDLGDNLANPDNIGSLYAGLNVISGHIDENLQGTGVLMYPDNDFDGFGDANSEALLLCSECMDQYSQNNLDCDDFNPDINPDAIEIAGNNIDENCDGSFLSTSISILNKDIISIFPNPTSSSINIECNSSDKISVTLLDFSGRVINIYNDKRTIDLSGFDSGVYFLDVINNSSKTMFSRKKIILTK